MQAKKRGLSSALLGRGLLAEGAGRCQRNCRAVRRCRLQIRPVCRRKGLAPRPANAICPTRPMHPLRRILAERWQSGRSRRTRNAEYRQRYRGFESLPLRHAFSRLAFSGPTAAKAAASCRSGRRAYFAGRPPETSAQFGHVRCSTGTSHCATFARSMILTGRRISRGIASPCRWRIAASAAMQPMSKPL